MLVRNDRARQTIEQAFAEGDYKGTYQAAMEYFCWEYDNWNSMFRTVRDWDFPEITYKTAEALLQTQTPQNAWYALSLGEALHRSLLYLIDFAQLDNNRPLQMLETGLSKHFLPTALTACIGDYVGETLNAIQHNDKVTLTAINDRFIQASRILNRLYRPPFLLRPKALSEPDRFTSQNWLVFHELVKAYDPRLSAKFCWNVDHNILENGPTYLRPFEYLQAAIAQVGRVASNAFPDFCSDHIRMSDYADPPKSPPEEIRRVALQGALALTNGTRSTEVHAPIVLQSEVRTHYKKAKSSLRIAASYGDETAEAMLTEMRVAESVSTKDLDTTERPFTLSASFKKELGEAEEKCRSGDPDAHMAYATLVLTNLSLKGHRAARAAHVALNADVFGEFEASRMLPKLSRPAPKSKAKTTAVPAQVGQNALGSGS